MCLALQISIALAQRSWGRDVLSKSGYLLHDFRKRSFVVLKEVVLDDRVHNQISQVTIARGQVGVDDFDGVREVYGVPELAQEETIMRCNSRLQGWYVIEICRNVDIGYRDKAFVNCLVFLLHGVEEV